ncbi:MAG: DUF2207 domain-containing protein [Lachnospiraceae bacterium]|nr:DUF2207 domain-containing protein [Lachnospiraceae bacterium]MBQ8233700.1 DUF2207 domain-containing protein [Lachnospiraceae bacterium]
MNNNGFMLKFCGFLAVVFLLVFASEGSYIIEDMQLNPNDYARITDVEYKAVVVDEPGSEGKVLITERLTFDVHAASEYNLFWELWRDLPEDYIDGVKVDYTVHSVKQIMPDGTEVIYDESPKLYWDDYDYVSYNPYYGPGKWYHSEGPYDESDAQYECVFFYVDGLYREEVVFEIEYEMHNAALRYNDCSDLYLALYSGTTIQHLNSFKAQILFPNEDMPSAGNYDVYTYGTNANEFPVTESATLNPGYYTFSFELDEEDLQFRPYNQYIEFDLVSHGTDKHIFTEYAPSNYYSNDDVLAEIYEEQQAYASTPARYKTIKTVVFVALTACGIYALFYAFTIKNRMKSKHTFYTPTMDMELFREIPSDLDPNFAAALVFCKHKAPKDDSGIYSAILLSLARKNYIDIEEVSLGNIKITIKKPAVQAPPQVTMTDMGLETPMYNVESPAPVETFEPLTPCEEYYYNLLVRHASGDTIFMSTLQQRISSDYYNTQTFVKNIDNSVVNIGVKDGYFQKADYTQPQKEIKSTAKFLWITGILLITLVNIISYQTRLELAFGAFFISGVCFMISSVYLKKQAEKFVLLTQFGEDEYAKWRGLYNFLNSDTLIHERTIVELPLWEKYLVYATAFGLSEKVIKAITIRCPEAAASASPVLNNTYHRSRSFRSCGRSFHSAVRSGSHGGGYHGGGGGFGYGGGGRGGGGGGGGH